MSALDWLNLLTRWVHFIAGIAWIGSSLYFIWLDSHLEKPATPKERVEGELWMVHSGGFYQVEKRHIGPGLMPKTLHWFKWEAAITWISGLFLLGVVYYMTRGLYLVDPAVSGIGVWSAAGIGFGAIMASWIVYDLIWQSPLRLRSGLATVICYVLAAGLTYGLCQVLSGRAAFVHVGAALGTIMVANVWERILPAQQKMIDATAEGGEPDLQLGLDAKRRSVHNSYMTFPVLIIMLSNHYPAAWGHPLNWLVLGLLMIVGGGARHLMIGSGTRKYWVLAPVLAAFLALVVMTAPMAPGARAYDDLPPGEVPTFQQAKAVITSRCIICHSATPADDTFGPMPGGVSFDTDEAIQAQAGRIFVRAVATKTMPQANRTKITEDERALLGRWVKAGAPIE